MAYERVSQDGVRAMLEDMAVQIERGGVTSATIRWCTKDGEEHEHTFDIKTEEDRIDALLAIRAALGQVH